MGITKVDIRVCRIDKPDMCRTVKGAVVDTGATVSAIPSKILRELGISLPIKRRFTLADGRIVTKNVGSAWIEVDGRKASDDIISIQKGSPLLGVRALEGLGYEVDPRTQKLKKLAGSLLL